MKAVVKAAVTAGMEDPAPALTDPDAHVPLGEIQSPDGERIEQRVRILTGEGQWAYWVSAATHLRVVADTIFNPHAPHFAGWLREFHLPGHPEDQWLVVHGWQAPPPERKVYIEDEDAGLPRMERR